MVKLNKIKFKNFSSSVTHSWGFPGGSDGKESVYNVGDLGSIRGLGRFPWRREWQSTPVLLLGEFHGQRSLAGYSSWNHQESDTTKRLTHVALGYSTHYIKEPCQHLDSTFSLQTVRQYVYVLCSHEFFGPLLQQKNIPCEDQGQDI